MTANNRERCIKHKNQTKHADDACVDFKKDITDRTTECQMFKLDHLLHKVVHTPNNKSHSCMKCLYLLVTVDFASKAAGYNADASASK